GQAPVSWTVKLPSEGDPPPSPNPTGDLTYNLAHNDAPPPENLRHTVVLQRLTNPWLPPDANPLSPTYNPYVTVDYVSNVKTWDAVQYLPKQKGTGRAQRNQFYKQPPERFSYGRPQPYEAANF